MGARRQGGAVIREPLRNRGRSRPSADRPQALEPRALGPARLDRPQARHAASSMPAANVRARRLLAQGRRRDEFPSRPACLADIERSDHASDAAGDGAGGGPRLSRDIAVLAAEDTGPGWARDAPRLAAHANTSAFSRAASASPSAF